MRSAVLAAALCLLLLLQLVLKPRKPVETLPVTQIHAGMHGVAYTVFQGTKPEPMEVEVLGILKNANGPKGDVILVRLGGAKAEYTGVVAGMSGSPVYLDGKLAGAVAFRIGEFSKEPIAGVTPIAEMLEISALDRTPAAVPVDSQNRRACLPAKSPAPESAARIRSRISPITSGRSRPRWSSTDSQKTQCSASLPSLLRPASSR